MTVLVVGATGATGRLLLRQLLERGVSVRAVVRDPNGLPEDLRQHRLLQIFPGTVLDLTDAEVAKLIEGCGAVASCLGHNLTFRGIFGSPRRLVRDTTRRLCSAIKASHPGNPVRFVLMNTAGNSNRGINEKISFSEKCFLSLIRLLLPPHVDNEQAADFLRHQAPKGDRWVEWVAVRPDTLTNATEITPYELFRSPTRSPLFNAGKSSRINVAHFMAELLTKTELWAKWKGQMPVLYNG